jgi:S-formylglutathione hydrolase FrmB
MALVTMNFYSVELGMNSAMHVILPDKVDGMGRALRREPDYPVLWLLHGGGDNHTKWLRFTSIERYAEEKRIAVIMPSSLQGWYTDMKYGYKYFTFLSEELPKIVHANFPKISQKREDTFAAGLSMGGMGALKMAFNAPERFAAAASLTSSIEMTVSMGRSIDKNGNPAPALRNIWGSKEEIAGTVNDVPWLIDRAIESSKPLPKVFIAVGTEDFTYQCNVNFRDKYRDKLDLTYFEEPGAHSWDFWDRNIKRVLDWLPITGGKVGA